MRLFDLMWFSSPHYNSFSYYGMNEKNNLFQLDISAILKFTNVQMFNFFTSTSSVLVLRIYFLWPSSFLISLPNRKTADP